MWDILNIENFSLFAYADSNLLEVWRQDIIEKERKRQQTLKENVHTDTYGKSYSRMTGYSRSSHTNMSQTVHTDSYNELGNIHTNIPAKDSYDQKGNIHTNKAGYDKNIAHSNTKAKYTENDKHTKTAHYNFYGKRPNKPYEDGAHVNTPHKNSYSRYSKYTPHSDYNCHTKTSHDKSYLQGTGYSKSDHIKSYLQGTGYSKHSNAVHTDASGHNNTSGYATDYTPGYDKGFDHVNYIPSVPELYDIDGNVLAGEITFNLQSYDKNTDGYGFQDEDSRIVYYDLQVIRVQDLAGAAVTEEWTTLLTNSTDTAAALDFTGKEDGIYEVEAVARNKPRTEKGVTQTYESETKQAFFTVSQGLADMTILNGTEFANYSFGIDQMVSPAQTIKKYVAGLIYANGKDTEQKGLFVEFNLTDLKEEGYHKVKASLEVNGTAITDKYDVTFELDEDGISPKAGNKKGVVFIPLEDMLGIHEDANLVLDITEYEDKAFSKQRRTTQKRKGVNNLKEVLYVDIDNVYPFINVTAPDEGYVTNKQITLSFSDTGLGIMKSFYQVVEHGKAPLDDNWVEVGDVTASKIINVEGIWDLYARTLDKAGNETSLLNAPYVYRISPVVATLRTPPKATFGKDFTASSDIKTKTEITKVEFWIKDYTSPVEGKLDSKLDDLSLYTAKITVPDKGVIPEGTHIVFEKIYLADGTTKTLSKTIEITDALPIEIESATIEHTVKWNENRGKYNALVDDDRQRSSLVFWSGEKFLPKVVGTGIVSGRAYIEGTSYSSELVQLQTDETVWSCELWDEDMMFKWGQTTPKELTIMFELVDASEEKTLQPVTIIVDDIVKYYQLHRKL